MFSGYELLAWIVGGTFLYVMYRRAVRLAGERGDDA